MPKLKLEKKKVYFVQAKVWTHLHTIAIQVHNQFNQVIFHDNIHTSKIISLLIMLQTHHQKIIKLNNTQLPYIGLEPKSSHIYKVLSTTWASTFPRHKG